MTDKIKIRQYTIFIEPRKIDTADIKCLQYFGPLELLITFKILRILHS